MKNAVKVASSNGEGYSIKFQKEGIWKTFNDYKMSEYRVPPNYIPHHMKVLKTACKLFMGSKIPGYIKDSGELSNAVFTAIKHT